MLLYVAIHIQIKLNMSSHHFQLESTSPWMILLLICKCPSNSENPVSPSHPLIHVLNCSFPVSEYWSIRTTNPSPHGKRSTILSTFPLLLVSETRFQSYSGAHLFLPGPSRTLFPTFVIQLDSSVTSCIPSWDSPSFLNSFKKLPTWRFAFVL